ncbi:hypothetical protein V1520DRAFT_331083 [Lipomyces starkeyi]|uniref:Uncharacterized protein n=1 Tax=Lipomyces starkeyi NRRL Y-11557 TaxID=675824 RepID=A0A1E3PWQ2_LIPST|nr:hypothetical protein LIPSTDRAFT_75350 [Lipomyces starkeyi NRRL Y-11557]
MPTTIVQQTFRQIQTALLLSVFALSSGAQQTDYRGVAGEDDTTDSYLKKQRVRGIKTLNSVCVCVAVAAF